MNGVVVANSTKPRRFRIGRLSGEASTWSTARIGPSPARSSVAGDRRVLDDSADEGRAPGSDARVGASGRRSGRLSRPPVPGQLPEQPSVRLELGGSGDRPRLEQLVLHAAQPDPEAPGEGGPEPLAGRSTARVARGRRL